MGGCQLDSSGSGQGHGNEAWNYTKFSKFLNSLEAISVSQQTVLHEVMLLAHQNCIHRHSVFLKVVCSLFSTRFVAFTERDSRHTQNITVL